ncbi:hypothetical protein ACSBR2_038279 [Camellia fascicularis]
MANDRQKKRIGGDIPSGSGKNAESNVDEDNCNEEPRDKNPGEKDIGQEGDAPKKAWQGGYYNESDLQNNIMQPPFLLENTPIPVAKNDA